MAAAITLLGEQGEQKATMTAICQAAGLTERYFYESFRNRDEALVAALDEVCRELATSAVAAVEATDGEPLDRTRAALRAAVDVLVAAPAKARVVVVESSASAPLRARRRELVAWFAGVVTDEARSILGERALPADRLRVHATFFVAGLAELVADWLHDEPGLTPDRLVEVGSELFVAVARRD
nr:TetR/AcrR family transcriptional regulator [Nocardioides sp. zg-DK7169]